MDHDHDFVNVFDSLGNRIPQVSDETALELCCFVDSLKEWVKCYYSEQATHYIKRCAAKQQLIEEFALEEELPF